MSKEVRGYGRSVRFGHLRHADDRAGEEENNNDDDDNNDNKQQEWLACAMPMIVPASDASPWWYAECSDT